MNRLLLGSAATVALVAGAVLAAPSFIDWNRYRGEVASVLQLATGRTVTITGDLDLALLPRPVLSAGDVRLELPDGTPIAEVGSVDLSVRPLALLRGAVQVETLSLVRPALRIELLPDGRWLLPVDPAALGGALRIDRADVEGGTLTITDRRRPDRARDVVLDGLTGMAAADGPDGPFRFDGGFALAGRPVELDLVAGRRIAGAPLPLRLTVTLPDTGGAEGTLGFAGVLASAATSPELKGEVKGGGAGIGALLGTLAAGLDEPAPADMPGLAQPWTLRAGLTWTAGQRVLLDGIEAAMGDTRAVGSIDLPLDDEGAEQGSVVLSFTALDLDAWTGAGTPDLPRTPPLALDLLADTVAHRGGVLRNLALVGSLSDRVLTVERAQATLPGGLEVQADGTLSTRTGRPAFDLTLSAATQNLRAALDWAGLDVGHVPAERLRTARIDLRAEGHSREFRLLDLAASVDTSRITGAVSYSGMDERPAIGLRAEIDRADLDAYLPDGLSWSSAMERTAEIDLNLEAKAGQLTLAGVPVEGLDLSAALVDGALDLRRLAVASAAGVSGSVSGSVGGLSPLRAVTLSGTLETQGTAPLFRALGMAPPVPPERLGPVRLTGRVVGGAERLALEVEAGLLGGTVTAGGNLLDPGGTPTADLKLRATLPEVVEAARLVWPEWRPAEPKLGPLDLYAAVRGHIGKLAFADVQGSAGPATVRSGTVVVDRVGERPAITADLTTGPLDPALFLSALGRGELGTGWARETSLTLDLMADQLDLPRGLGGGILEAAALSLTTAADGVVEIGRLEGGWRGGALSATGRLAPAGQAGLAADLRLALTDVDFTKVDWPQRTAAAGAVALSGGTLTLALEGRAAGSDLDALRGGLEAAGSMRLVDTTLSGIDLPRLAAGLPEARGREPAEALLTRALGGGVTPLAELAGPVALAGGVLRSGGLTAAAAGGTLTIAGSADLTADTIDATLRLDPADAPALTLALSGPVADPEREVRADALLSWAAARAAFVPPPPLILPPATADGITGPTAGSEPGTPPPDPVPQTAADTPAGEPATDQPQDGQALIQGILDKLKAGSGS